MNLLKTNFNKDGIIKIKKLFGQQNKLRNIIYNIAKDFIDIRPIKSFEDNEFHKSLLDFRKKNPKKFGEMYDRLNLNASLRSIFYQDKFMKLFAKILGINKANLYINGFMLRLDPPNDKRNSLDWHQDSPYYEMGHPKYNSGVCWVALTNNLKKNGTLIYVPKSHHDVKKASFFKKNNNYSGQYRLKINEKKNICHLIAKSGDVSFIHMNTIHKSGENKSKKFRITLGCRFHQMNRNFNTGKEIYFYNKTNSQRLI